MLRVTWMFALSLFLAVPGSNAQPAPEPAGFMAVDIFGGFATHVGYGSADVPNDGEASRFNGWDLGATFRPRPRFGIKGTVGRTWNAGTRVMHYLVGPSLTTSYGGNYFGARAFAHMLVGVGSVSAPELPATTGLEIVAGGGFDIWYVIRIQIEYLRLPDAPPGPAGTLATQHQVRAVLAGVLPLCFRGCRPNDTDGISVSK